MRGLRGALALEASAVMEMVQLPDAVEICERVILRRRVADEHALIRLVQQQVGRHKHGAVDVRYGDHARRPKLRLPTVCVQQRHC